MTSLVFQDSDPFLWERLKGLPPDAVCVTRTDTIYGLGCRYNNVTARERIMTIKNRSDAQFITLVADMAQAEALCEISEDQVKILLQYWPAAISFVLKGRETQPTLALRQPALPFAQKMVEIMGGAMLSTSCNLSGNPPVETIAQALELFGDKVDFYVDSGTLMQSTPSTLVDLTSNPPTILRPGIVPFPIPL